MSNAKKTPTKIQKRKPSAAKKQPTKSARKKSQSKKKVLKPLDAVVKETAKSDKQVQKLKTGNTNRLNKRVNYILYRIVGVAFLIILVSFYLGTRPVKNRPEAETDTLQTLVQEEIVETQEILPEEEISDDIAKEGSEEENEDSPHIWQPDQFVMYKKEIEVARIDTSDKSDWFCTVITKDGEKYAVYQPYQMTFNTTSNGYTVKSTHQLAPSALSSWLYDMQAEGIDKKRFKVRIQNYPELNERNPMPNGTDEIPRDMDYIIELLAITDIKTGKTVLYDSR